MSERTQTTAAEPERAILIGAERPHAVLPAENADEADGLLTFNGLLRQELAKK